MEFFGIILLRYRFILFALRINSFALRIEQINQIICMAEQNNPLNPVNP